MHSAWRRHAIPSTSYEVRVHFLFPSPRADTSLAAEPCLPARPATHRRPSGPAHRIPTPSRWRQYPDSTYHSRSAPLAERDPTPAPSSQPQSCAGARRMRSTSRAARTRRSCLLHSMHLTGPLAPRLGHRPGRRGVSVRGTHSMFIACSTALTRHAQCVF